MADHVKPAARTRSAQLLDLAQRDVITVTPETTLTECARLMRSEHVGCLVVAVEGRPLGVVTDRDIVIEAVAVQLDPATLTAGDVMSQPPATVRESDDLFDALALMRERGVRRLPVLDGSGKLSGLLAVDNVLEVLAEQVDSVVRVVKAEQTKETVLRR
jgi:CBS domain-containing protein